MEDYNDDEFEYDDECDRPEVSVPPATPATVDVAGAAVEVVWVGAHTAPILDANLLS